MREAWHLLRCRRRVPPTRSNLRCSRTECPTGPGGRVDTIDRVVVAAGALSVVLAAWMVLVQPFAGRRRYRRLIEHLYHDPSARLRHYRRGIAFEWAGAALVGVLALLAHSRLRSLWPPGENTGVAAQIPCKYCMYFHREAAKMNGATAAEIDEAIAVAGDTRASSALMYGAQVDMAKFRKDIDAVIKHLQKTMPAQPKAASIP